MYIIIVGCGRLGSYLAKGLSDGDNDVCIIDRNGDRLNALGGGFNGQRIKGIEFDRDNLIEAGIVQADALLAVTSDDNINITVSLIAEKLFHVPQIIARVNDPEKDFIYNKLCINTINPIHNEIEILKSKLPINTLDVLSTLDNDYEIIEFLVNKDKSVMVGEIEDKYHCIISGVMEAGVIRLPQKNEFIENDNKIICTIQKKDKGKLINYLCKEIFL